MRPELEQLAQVDAYVSKNMNAAEKAAFETTMQINPAVQEAVEMQQLLVTAINRKALMAHVTAATAPTFIPPRNGTILSRFKWPIILSSIFIGAVITWIGSTSGDSDVAKAHERLHQTERATKNQNSLLAVENDSLSAKTVDFTYEPIAKTTSIRPTYQREFGGLETWVTPEVQQVIVDPSKEELIECKDGTLILVPKNAFADPDGNAISEPVTLDIIEALTMDKMVAYNLATMSNGDALKSGGMVYVQPTLNGTDLELAEGKSLHIEIPTDDYDPSMKAWDGIANGKGDLNWENPKEIENYLIPVSMNSLEFLPEGFREEVAATLPFKKYQRSSKRLEDSLYYGLNNSNISEKLEQDNTKKDVEKEQSTSKINKTFSSPQVTLGAGRNTPPKSSKPRKGIAAIQFENLPNDGNYIASYYIGKRQITDTLKESQILTDFIGFSSISLQRNDCSPFIFKSVEFKNGEITTLNCSQWDCGLPSGPAAIFSASSSSKASCFIDPSAVYAAQNSDFENTFIATREFQERLQALHTIKNAQPLFDLYINQLDKNLSEIDSQVAARLTGDEKAVFEIFAAQKLTNVKPDGQNYGKLKQFYTSQVGKHREEKKQQQREYNQKSAEELIVVQSEIAAVRSKFMKGQQQIRRRYSGASNLSTSQATGSKVTPVRQRTFTRNSRPAIGRQLAYKVNWYSTGWMNIDSYLHELSKGKKEIPIAAKGNGKMKVYQSINSLKTLLSLNNIGGEYTAHFPSAQRPVYSNSIILGVSRNDGKLKLAARFFNPYTTESIALNSWEEVSEDEFKRRLKEIYPGGKSMLRGLAAEERAMQAAIERKARAEEQRKKKEAELKVLEEQFKAASATLRKQEQEIQKRQAAERAYVRHLVDFVDPCSDSDRNTISKTRQPQAVTSPNLVNVSPEISYNALPNAKWDEGPKYPGGFIAMTNYIAQNIQYPQEAIDQGVQGNVYVQVTLTNQGRVEEVQVIRSEPDSPILEKEAMRVIMDMPNWEPATRGEVFVPSRTTFPVSFVLID